MHKKRIIVAVTNDIVNDQRVHKICTFLEQYFTVLLVGRKLKNSKPLHRNYATKRFRLFFNTGFLFYAEFNLRLFWFLLFKKKSVILANDLDTLLPGFLVSKLQKKTLFYDTHEYFTEVPELVSRPKVQKIWLAIEQYIFPKLKNVYTVNTVIANIYTKKYGVPVQVVRNIAPKLQMPAITQDFEEKVKQGKKMLIIQGTGINVDRGAEEAVATMQYLDNCILYIIGKGDVFETLKAMCAELQLNQKVVILDRMPYQELLKYTYIADIGLSLDKNTNLNYEYSLPNKVFDYIQTETPLLVSNRKLVGALVRDNNIGAVISEITPKNIAKTIKEMLSDTASYSIWKQNLKTAKETFTWENETLALKKIYLDKG